MECDGKQCDKGKLIPGNKYLCPHNNLEAKFPELKTKWDTTNEKKMCEYLPNSGQKTRWICDLNPCGCHLYEAVISNITGQKPYGCPYCSGRRPCAHNNLEVNFPQLKKEWSDDNEKKMCEYTSNTNERVKWICDVNPCGDHIWMCQISDRTRKNTSGCPFCANQKACAHNNLEVLCPHLKKEWSPDNKPMNLYTKNSSIKVLWVCLSSYNNHKWITKISHRTGNRASSCPHCKNKTEAKLFEHLTLNYDYEIEKPKKFEWCKNKKCLPFDFCIEELKLIIELDGRQHFEQISNWDSPLLTQKTDKYKMKCANENGYSVIRLLQEDVWTDTNDWKNNLKLSIKKYDTLTNLFFGDCYDNYKIIDEVNDDIIDEVYTKKIIKPIVNSNIKLVVKAAPKPTITTNNKQIVKAAPKTKSIITTNNKRVVKIVPKSSIKTTSKTNNDSNKVRTISKNE